MLIRLTTHFNQEIATLIKQHLNSDVFYQCIPGRNEDIIAFSEDYPALKNLSFVKEVIISDSMFPLASLEYKSTKTQVRITDDIIIGGSSPIIMAGPCSCENYLQLETIATIVKDAGADIFRAGAYKPRTSPYTFQGLESEGIHLLKKINQAFNLPIVSEIMSSDKLPEFLANIDILQVGAKNMQNYELLKALSIVDVPILLKRHPLASVSEWLLSAEYLLAGGNNKVILCERGSKDPKTQQLYYDEEIIHTVRSLTHLPIIFDPSHATKDYRLVNETAIKALEAGYDGLIVEVHHQPNLAYSDGSQSLNPEHFIELMNKINKL